MSTDIRPLRLGAFLAGLSELQESERLAVFRAHLEYTLDVMQANEEAYFAILGECAQLAANNMQDVRLENLELQVNALEHPPEKPWGEVFTDVALSFALQVGVVLGAEVAATGVIAAVGLRSIMKATRTSRAELIAARSETVFLNDTLLHLQAKKAALRVLRRGGFSFQASRGGWRVQPGSFGFRSGPAFTVPGHAFTKLGNQVVVNPAYLRDEYDTVVTHISIAQAATTTNSVRVSKAVKTYEDAVANAAVAAAKIKSGWGRWWRENIGNERGGVLLDSTMNVMTAIGQGAHNQDADVAGSSGEPFLTSEITGRYLEWVCEERLDTVENYAFMRLLLRSTADEQLQEGDEFIQHIALLGTEVVQRCEELRQRLHAARAAIVRGMEAALWCEYLRAHGILPVQPVKTTYTARHPLEVGAVAGEYLIESDGKEFVHSADMQKALERMQQESFPEPIEVPPPLYEHEASRYPGTERIPALLAGTLFKRFAQPYFATAEHANGLKPFTYHAERYANVQIPPEDTFWGYPDPEALRRIDEMRFMVAHFFFQLATNTEPDPALSGIELMKSVTGSDANATREQWLAAQPQGSGEVDPDAALKAMLLAEEHLKRMLQTFPPAPGSPLGLRIRELHLADLLADLNHDIQTYLLLTNGALEIDRTVDARTPDDVLREIQKEKDVVQDTYDELMLGAGTIERQRLEAIYKPAVDAIKGWHPASDWVWYWPASGANSDTP
jgi:hypothetical protein